MPMHRQRRPQTGKGASDPFRPLRRSALALGIATLLAATAHAQEAAPAQATPSTGTPTELDGVVVTGIRGSVYAHCSKWSSQARTRSSPTSDWSLPGRCDRAKRASGNMCPAR